MRSNLRTSLKLRPRGRTMDRYDRLPQDLRQWLAQAALPWSARSALRLWQRIQDDCAGDPSLIRQRLTQAENRTLARDAARVWGTGYPGTPQA